MTCVCSDMWSRNQMSDTSCCLTSSGSCCTTSRLTDWPSLRHCGIRSFSESMQITCGITILVKESSLPYWTACYCGLVESECVGNMLNVGWVGINLTHSAPAVPNCCCSKGLAPYWCYIPFYFWHSGALALSPECQSARMSKIKNGGLDQYGKV